MELGGNTNIQCITVLVCICVPCVPACVSMFACVSVCVHVHVCLHMCACVYMCACACVHQKVSSSAGLLSQVPLLDFLSEIASCLLQIGIWSATFVQPESQPYNHLSCVDVETVNTDKAKDIPESTGAFILFQFLCSSFFHSFGFSSC